MPLSKNSKTALVVVGIVVGMVGLSFAAVPLYDLFCRVTGFGGTTQVAAQLPAQQLDRTLQVQFNADVQRDLPWDFAVEQTSQTVALGAPAKAYFRVKNNSNHAITGVATYNVTPEKVGKYFNKVQCFCFEEHTLQPGEEQRFPVLFFIDPEMDTDALAKDIRAVTLSYTYFAAKDAPSHKTP